MKRQPLPLKRLTDGLLKNGAKEMTGRYRGVKIREALEKILREAEGDVCLVLNFSGMGPIDFSWADEVVAKMVSRLWSGEYGKKFLVLRGLNDAQQENIGVALERKRLAALVFGADGWRIIGSLNNYLAHTLALVMARRHLTLRQLSEEEGIGMNTSGTRLLNLYRKRLVRRIERPMTGGAGLPRGRQFVYQSLLA